MGIGRLATGAVFVFIYTLLSIVVMLRQCSRYSFSHGNRTYGLRQLLALVIVVPLGTVWE